MEKILLLVVCCILILGFASAYPSEERGGSSDLCDICGIQATATTPKIFNGMDVLEGEVPWRVYVRVGMKALCGGTIIHKNWVLTSALCLDRLEEGHEDDDSIYIRAGSINKWEGGQEVIVNGIRAKKHEHFRNRDGLLWNDTGLIEVPGPGFNFTNPNITPVCLPYKFRDVGMIHEGLASGWGRRNKTRNSTTEIMQKANLHIEDYEHCNKIVFESISWLKDFNYKIDAKQMCTASTTPNICAGDTGGSVDHRDDRGRYYAIGINSFGMADCGNPEDISVLARVAMYLDWIEKNTGEKFCTE